MCAYDVFLVIDVFNKNGDKRFYNAIPLYNDKLKINTWEHLIIEVDVVDILNELDDLKIYIWNHGQKEFEIKQVKYILEEYKV